MPRSTTAGPTAESGIDSFANVTIHQPAYPGPGDRRVHPATAQVVETASHLSTQAREPRARLSSRLCLVERGPGHGVADQLQATRGRRAGRVSYGGLHGVGAQSEHLVTHSEAPGEVGCDRDVGAAGDTEGHHPQAAPARRVDRREE